MATTTGLECSEGGQGFLLDSVERRLQVLRLCLLQRVFVSSSSTCKLQAKDQKPVSCWGSHAAYVSSGSERHSPAPKGTGNTCVDLGTEVPLVKQDVLARVSNLFNCNNPLCRALACLDGERLHPTHRDLWFRLTMLLNQRKQVEAAQGTALKYEGQLALDHAGESHEETIASSYIENGLYDSDVEDILSRVLPPSRDEVSQRLRQLGKRDILLLFCAVRTTLVEKRVLQNADRRLAHYWLNVFIRDALLMMADKGDQNLDSWSEACRQKLNEALVSLYRDWSIHRDTACMSYHVPVPSVPGVCTAAAAAPSFHGTDRAKQQLFGCSKGRGVPSQSDRARPVDDVFKVTAVASASGEASVSVHQLLQHTRRCLRSLSPSAAAILSPALLLGIIQHEATLAAGNRLLQVPGICSFCSEPSTAKKAASSSTSDFTTREGDLFKALRRIREANALRRDHREISISLPSQRDCASSLAHVRVRRHSESNCKDGDGNGDPYNGHISASSEAAKWLRHAFFITDDVFLA